MRRSDSSETPWRALKLTSAVHGQELELVEEQPEGAVYFVRIAPQKIVRMYAASPADALGKARSLVVPKG